MIPDGNGALEPAWPSGRLPARLRPGLLETFSWVEYMTDTSTPFWALCSAAFPKTHPGAGGKDVLEAKWPPPPNFTPPSSWSCEGRILKSNRANPIQGARLLHLAWWRRRLGEYRRHIWGSARRLTLLGANRPLFLVIVFHERRYSQKSPFCGVYGRVSNFGPGGPLLDENGTDAQATPHPFFPRTRSLRVLPILPKSIWPSFKAALMRTTGKIALSPSLRLSHPKMTMEEK